MTQQPWLDQVHADLKIAAAGLRVAYALAQQTDGTGLVAAAVARRLTLGDAGAEALEQLVAGGHLRRVRGGFRLLTASPTKAPQQAAVVPFPAARRGAYIRKQATRMAELSATHAEAHLRQQLRLQAETMQRKGVDERTIAREVRSLESAVRAELWRQIFAPERPAS